MSIQEYRAVKRAIEEAEVIRLFLKKQKERDALTLLIGLGNDKLQAIVEADQREAPAGTAPEICKDENGCDVRQGHASNRRGGHGCVTR